MVEEPSAQLAPITVDDVPAVARFLHEHLNTRVTAAQWAGAIVPSWQVESPNHGFMLRAGGDIVGVYLAIYSERLVGGSVERFCNLAAWCVLDSHRAHGLRLVRALLAQRGLTFTDLSPSGNVVALNRRLRFELLDTTTAMRPNLPWPPTSRRVRVTTSPAEIEELLDGRDLEIYRDHRDLAAARHVVLVVDDRACHVIVRKDRRKNLPVFASILHVSDPDVLRRSGGALYRHLLLRHGALVTLAELRVVGKRPRFSRLLSSPRPKMYRSSELRPEAVDYLYSELTCVAW